jgi:UDP-2,4-diacetamido-2,4,6-trideoxy-beta-L-altropyranose hydrolase
MRIMCRTDASVEIGTGHVVRCATLARLFADRGHQVQFVCRELPGDLNHWLAAEGFLVTRLAQVGDTETVDASACRDAIGELRYDWAIVDHYELGAAWEAAMAQVSDRLLVIDDLGRKHDCRLLLDQNYANATHARYRVPADCELLLGPKYALVRPEFARLRTESLSRRRDDLGRVLVFMGGSDPHNETCKALDGIAQIKRSNLRVDVVLGGGNPHRRAVEAACGDLPGATLHVQTARMAELMAEADCAVGAAGSSTWERCTLGLPALVTILAENQVPIAETVHAVGAHRLLGWYHALRAEDYAHALLALESAALSAMSEAAAEICDGRGAERVAARLAGPSERANPLLDELHG